MKRTLLSSVALATALCVASPVHAATPPHPSEACAPQDDGPNNADAMLGTGIGLTAGGAIVAALVGVPALLMLRNARADAERATYEARQRRYARRARRREIVAVAALGTGGVMMLIGVPLMIAGARRKNERRTAVTPVLTPTTAGVSASLRF